MRSTASFAWGVVGGLGLGLLTVWALESNAQQTGPRTSSDLAAEDGLEAENERLRRLLADRGPQLQASRTVPAPSKSGPAPTAIDATPDARRVGPKLKRLAGPGSSALPQHVPAHLRGTPEMWITALRRAEAKDDQQLCAYLEQALGALEPGAADALRDLVLDPEESDSLRARVLRALGQVSAAQLKTAVDEILRREPRDSTLFGEALSVLAASNSTSVPEAVIRLAQDPDAELAMRSHALHAVMNAEPAVAASIFRTLVRSADGPERQAAYRILGKATRPELAPLLHDMLRDSPGKSTAGLIPALARMKGPEWGNVQMTGAPDTPTAGDSATAWASKKEQDGVVTVELDYATEVTPDQVRVHETLSAGAIVRIEARLRDGTWAILWTGLAQAADTPRWFTPTLAPLDDRIRTVRITLDTDKVPNWNEIDAVELVGEGLRQWASVARSSSCYANAGG